MNGALLFFGGALCGLAFAALIMLEVILIKKYGEEEDDGTNARG